MTSSENHKTLQSYEDHIQEFIVKTYPQVTGGVKNWIDTVLDGLPLGAKIVELGSASGRDAAYMTSKGYTVECTDAAQSFVTHLQSQGFNARVHNAITDIFSQSYDLIFANAVLVHFTREDTASVIQKMLLALNDGGRFAFSLKRGEGEFWTDAKLNAPRFFCFWQRPDIETLLTTSGFARWTVSEDGSGHSSGEWLHIIAHKA